MAHPYFLEPAPPAGYNNQARSLSISNNNYNYNLENIAAAAGNSHGGLLRTPPPRFLSAPSVIHGHQFYPFVHLRPPPLLPPPILRPHRSLPSQPRSHSLNPKKSKSTKRSENNFSPATADRRAGSRTSSAVAKRAVVKVEELDLSECLFALSPPPSSLPLPKFCLRPAKLSCNVEAAGADDGATTADDLRRLLRLR